MSRKIKGIAVKDVEADEIWGFVGCNNRHKLNKKITDPHEAMLIRLSASSATQSLF